MDLESALSEFLMSFQAFARLFWGNYILHNPNVIKNHTNGFPLFILRVVVVVAVAVVPNCIQKPWDQDMVMVVLCLSISHKHSQTADSPLTYVHVCVHAHAHTGGHDSGREGHYTASFLTHWTLGLRDLTQPFHVCHNLTHLWYYVSS